MDHPKDPAGPTNHGITISTLSHELGRRATRTDVRNINIITAKSIFKKRYWNVVNGDALPSGVDLMLFDVAVNSGPGRAEQFDAKCGNLPPKDRIIALDRLRMGFYRRLSTWAVFGKGWTRRERACVELALKMVNSPLARI